MSCVLRVSGETFDVDGFLATSRMTPCKVWHVGDRRGHSDIPSKTAGFNAVMSEGALADFSASVRDAIQFLGRHRDEMQLLSNMVSVSSLCLDFAVSAQPENAAKFCHLPPELIRLAANAKMGIELSLYSSE